LVLAHRKIPFRLPQWRLVDNSLKLGWTMFIFRGSVTFYTASNTFILGLMASPQHAGFYAGAEKISRSVIGLLNPVFQALYPRLSHLAHNSRFHAAQLVRSAAKYLGTIGVGISFIIAISAPLLVRVILGPAYIPAITVVRILSLLAPLILLTNVYGVQWMLPLGMDAALNRIVICVGMANLGLACVLAPLFREQGMAWAAVSSEGLVLLAILVFLSWKGVSPSEISRNHAAILPETT
jgi:polysaccharide transporter, PST family